MVNTIIWDPIERFLWGIVFAVLLMCAALYILRGREKVNFNERIIMYGFAFYFIGLAFGRLFYTIGDLFITGTYINSAFFGDYRNASSSFELFTRLNYISRAIGVALFLLMFEISIKRTKYILTIIQVPLIILMIILPYNYARNIDHYILTPLGLIAIIIILYKFTIWSHIELKAISSLLFFGVTLMAIALNLNSRDIKSLRILPLYISPIIYTIGALTAILPLVIDPEYFSRALKFWITFGILIITSILFMDLFYIIGGAPLYNIIIVTFFLIVLMLFVLQVIKNIITEINPEVKKKQKVDLSIFNRPPRITEAEISIHKERKICLVCKGKLAGFNLAFICRKCDSLYCENCARSLSDLENACWVCDASFDESKPVKPFKKEEEIDTEISTKHKKKLHYLKNIRKRYRL